MSLDHQNFLEDEMRQTINQGVSNGGYDQAEADERFNTWRATYIEARVIDSCNPLREHHLGHLVMNNILTAEEAYNRMGPPMSPQAA